jgi:hypothetical protein
MEKPLKYSFRKQGAMVCTGFIWLRIGTRGGGGEAVVDMVMSFVFHNIAGVSWVAEQQSCTQDWSWHVVGCIPVWMRFRGFAGHRGADSAHLWWQLVGGSVVRSPEQRVDVRTVSGKMAVVSREPCWHVSVLCTVKMSRRKQSNPKPLKREYSDMLVFSTKL